MMVLSANQISKSYGDLEVLKDLSMEILQSEIVAIVGKSGSGKSTLLHILGTLDSPDCGEVHIDDTQIIGMSAKEISKVRNEKIGFIFQFHHLLNEFTAVENVIIPALVKGVKRADAINKAEELLSYLGLSGRLNHKPSQLSGGEQQRVAVARALINDPKIIFADEPTGNLDDSTSEELFELIQKLRDDYKQTFVIVTHSKDIADKCDRILTLNNKKIEDVGP
jgi:lipoprotein-releasing system ATP-binding protein